MTDERLIVTFVPSLVSVLLAHERRKESPLTEQEVLEIRGKATVVALPAHAAANVEKERGYRDIDPENCWQEWQQARLELDTSPQHKA